MNEWTRWNKRAHPRVCGENHKVFERHCYPLGSSPRMRGKLFYSWPTIEDHGLIPAYAGKTVPAARAPIWGRAHPRVCGENFQLRVDLALDDGSSPRMRGKQCIAADRQLRNGLIPAYAGKTTFFIVFPLSLRAHPRVCGENWASPRVISRPSGSSPRMRGKPDRRNHSRPHDGLIPAYAGKTIPSVLTTMATWAHPRVCGENDNSGTGIRRCNGSSPRMRGKRTDAYLNACSNGLIPAYAGKTGPG